MRTLPLLLILAGCSAADWRDDADEAAYGILEAAATEVTGEAKTFDIVRPANTLRRRLLEEATETIQLDLPTALDVAAENSREFQTRKEGLYLVALALTQQQRNLGLWFNGGAGSDVSGVGDDSSSVSIRDDLFAFKNTESGGRIVASFVNTFLKDLVNGGSFNGSSILGLSLTQPLLRGSGRRIVREPLTQAERNVIYQTRTFERFRATFAVSVASQYYRVLQQFDNLQAEQSNAEGTQKNRERVEALVEAGRLAGVDLDRASQQEFDANDRLNNARVSYLSALDSFKLTLGLPTDAVIELDSSELVRLRRSPIVEIDLEESAAIDLALARRFDYRNTVDQVADAGRKVVVAENALMSFLDFSGAISVPTEPDKPATFDWSRVEWSAGFDFDLALDRIAERNAYRSTLISLEVAIRDREESEDFVKSDVRDALRAIRRTFTSYGIQSDALRLSERRLERADDFLQAGRGNTLALLDAQEDLLSSRLAVTRAVVDYAIARLQLLRDLEALVLEPKGLRYDPGLPLPVGGLPGTPPSGDAE